MNQVTARYWRHFDFPLLTAVLLLVMVGIAFIYSASRSTLSPGTPLEDIPAFRQLLFATMGLTAMAILAMTDYRILGNLAPALYVTTLAALVAVLVFGDSSFGARRWIDLHFILLQPSEIAKLMLIIVLAKFLAASHEKLRRLPVFLASFALILVPAMLVYRQPDLGTLVIIGLVWLVMVIFAGARWLHLGGLGLAAGSLAPLAYSGLLQDYMRERLRIFLDPASDPLGAGYNMLQAEISIGSGGLFGKGFGQGTQSQLDFLRVKSTDFLFSVLGEEIGFVGALMVLSLFLVLLFRGLRVATLARDPFGRYVAIGIVAAILFQLFINIGVNIRLLPVTGVPLPLVSQGGTSLLSNLLALGLLQSIVMRHRSLEF